MRVLIGTLRATTILLKANGSGKHRTPCAHRAKTFVRWNGADYGARGRGSAAELLQNRMGLGKPKANN